GGDIFAIMILIVLPNFRYLFINDPIRREETIKNDQKNDAKYGAKG
ncbi:2751_t:CDS:1, partial [Acaulospora morrowiae]